MWYQLYPTKYPTYVGGFLKQGCPQIIHVNGIVHYKPSIGGVPHHFRKNHILIYIYIWLTGND